MSLTSHMSAQKVECTASGQELVVNRSGKGSEMSVIESGSGSVAFAGARSVGLGFLAM